MAFVNNEVCLAEKGAGFNLLDLIFNSLLLLGILLLPLVAFALTIHFLELAIQSRLAGTFGWRSVLLTGWLGTPIHELSHVVFCWIFRHRIDEVRLFDPDIVTGRLGYVRHSYRRGNHYEEFGNVFIGTAPLLGGTLVMLVWLFLFYPDLATALLRKPDAVEVASWGQLIANVLQTIWQFLVKLFTWEHLKTPRLWVFLYLTLCVGSHMAPSRSDYVGGARGAWMVLGLLWLVALFLMAFTPDPLTLALNIFQLATPLVILGGLTIALSSTTWALVTLVVSIRG